MKILKKGNCIYIGKKSIYIIDTFAKVTLKCGFFMFKNVLILGLITAFLHFKLKIFYLEYY